MKVHVLMTKWKDGDPGISGVFSSFGDMRAWVEKHEVDELSEAWG